MYNRNWDSLDSLQARCELLASLLRRALEAAYVETARHVQEKALRTCLDDTRQSLSLSSGKSEHTLGSFARPRESGVADTRLGIVYRDLLLHLCQKSTNEIVRTAVVYTLTCRIEGYCILEYVLYYYRVSCLWSSIQILGTNTPLQQCLSNPLLSFFIATLAQGHDPKCLYANERVRLTGLA